jgi:geranylgeranyl diphosphate synthase type I
MTSTADVDTSADSTTIQNLLAVATARVNRALRAYVRELPDCARQWSSFHFGWTDDHGQAISGGRQGKGLRPGLAYAVAQMLDADLGCADHMAIAVELVHNFSLVHDDVIDRDVTRRGRPTVWAAHGEPAAVLTGDALMALAFQILGRGQHARLVPRLCRAVQDLIEGEALDVAYETREDVSVADYVQMARLKTGALFGAACALGAAACGADPMVIQHLDRYGQALGLAFQISDDLLGLFGDPRRTGKPVGGDLRQRKRTYPVLAALSSPHPAATRLAESYRDTKDLEPTDLAELTVLIEETGARRSAPGCPRRHRPGRGSPARGRAESSPDGVAARLGRARCRPQPVNGASL